MSAKAYVLLEVAEGRTPQVVKRLEGRPGVLLVEALEGPPDVMLVVEAAGRFELAKLTISALGLVESYTNDVHCLPVSGVVELCGGVAG